MTPARRRAPVRNPADPCCFPDCTKPQASLITHPLCAAHAQAVYLDVRDLVDAADPLTRAAAVGAKGTARPGHGRAGLVYYFRFGNLVKIGYTTNLAQRVHSLRPDEVMGTEPGSLATERARHMRFGRAYQGGEMFRLTPALRAHIEGLKET